MRLLIIACVALPISAAAAEPVSRPQPERLKFVQATPDKQCPKPLMHGLDPRGKGEFKKLNELPPAEAFSRRLPA